ncbi:MAG TPA: substrate-binding domain-containing protein [Xanthobacteraceae bacterium]|jgi:ABC-type molybdate transport system substrate-binding protein
MRAIGRTVVIATMLVLAGGMARAADIRVLGIDAVQEAVRALAAEFGKDTGQEVAVTFASPEAALEKIRAGDIFDALIASEAAMDELDVDGIVNPESRVRLASAGTGLDMSYEGALMSDGSEPQAARAFIRFLASPDARPHWLAAKLEPVAEP